MEGLKRRWIFTVTNDLSYDQRMQRICSSLAAAGFEVSLIGRLRSGSAPLVDRGFRQVRLRCFFPKGPLFYLEYNLRLFVYLIRVPCEGICSIDLDTLLAGYLASRLRGKKLVYDAHEYFTEVPEVVRRPRIQRIWSALADWIIPKVKYAYTVGPGLAEILTRRYGTPFSVIRNLPLAAEGLPERSAGNPFTLLYQGALNEGRGLESLLEAMALMKDEPVRLWLAGEGDKSDVLREMARRLNLGDRVIFHGYLQPEALRGLTAQSDMGFNLLENRGLSYYYSLANKAFDYIQFGIPSVQMDFPEYRALQETFGVFLLVSDLDPNTLAGAVRRLYTDPGYYRQLCILNRRAAAALTWERESRLLVDFYLRIGG